MSDTEGPMLLLAAQRLFEYLSTMSRNDTLKGNGVRGGVFRLEAKVVVEQKL